MPKHSKGIWMGGWAPLGYEIRDRKLVVNEEDAKLVRSIFQRFLKTGSATILARQLIQEGGPQQVRQIDRQGMLYKLLNNPVYIGDAVHKGYLTLANTLPSSIARSGTRYRPNSRSIPGGDPVPRGHRRHRCLGD
jgi:Recombinase